MKKFGQIIWFSFKILFLGTCIFIMIVMAKNLFIKIDDIGVFELLKYSTSFGVLSALIMLLSNTIKWELGINNLEYTLQDIAGLMNKYEKIKNNKL